MSPTAILIVVVLGVLLLALALRSVLGSKSRDVIDRLEREVGSAGRGAGPAEPSIGGQEPSTGLAARVASSLGKMARPGEAEEISRIKEKLMQGGFRQHNAVEMFFGG